MSTPESQPKKTRGPVKSVSDKLRGLLDAKRKQVATLEQRALKAQAEADKHYAVHGAACDELAKLESAIGAAS